MSSELALFLRAFNSQRRKYVQGKLSERDFPLGAVLGRKMPKFYLSLNCTTLVVSLFLHIKRETWEIPCQTPLLISFRELKGSVFPRKNWTFIHPNFASHVWDVLLSTPLKTRISRFRVQWTLPGELDLPPSPFSSVPRNNWSNRALKYLLPRWPINEPGGRGNEGRGERTIWGERGKRTRAFSFYLVVEELEPPTCVATQSFPVFRLDEYNGSLYSTSPVWTCRASAPKIHFCVVLCGKAFCSPLMGKTARFMSRWYIPP